MTPADRRRLTVDGEVFEVRPTETGQGFHFDWISGPNPGYGFSTGTSMAFAPVGEGAITTPEADDAAQVEQIREFLARVDPGTGYLPD